ncbi:DUF547 domain-containing protein [Lacinutrix mariniflava]|uniref:DUF547 domain-containing protein n=1 Tax=Lacinutrix mariniflava TaxID=342955 RepID=UPI0006E23EDD|nr:DUF547 domain-containing protein [Lacinutrix mariniflava]
MKHLILLALTAFLFSCSGAKKVIENSPKEQPKEIVASPVETTPEVVIETPIKVVETELEIETEEIIETADVIKHETIIANPETFNHEAWNSLLQDYVSDAGNVNYKDLKSNRKKLTNYIASLSDNMPNDTWKKEDKLAYWMNAYNAMTVDLILRNYPLQSIKDIKDPWDQRLWKLDNKWYNLEEIEHQILRKMDEPRIHFGIVCASFSCPKLQNEAFTASNLEMQLTNATREFLADKNRNIISKNTLKLSKIFKWFKKDFEQNGSLIDFLNTYSDISISEKANKSYLDYNWDLND